MTQLFRLCCGFKVQGKEMNRGLTRFKSNPNDGMSPSDFTQKNAFTTEDKTEINHFYHQSDDESTLAGVWECAPCREDIKAYPVNEMMTVVSGSVTVTEQGSTAETFTAGDTFFIAKGTECVWEITETLRKFYFIA